MLTVNLLHADCQLTTRWLSVYYMLTASCPGWTCWELLLTLVQLIFIAGFKEAAADRERAMSQVLGPLFYIWAGLPRMGR